MMHLFGERARCIWGLIDNLARGQDNLVDGCNSSRLLLVVWIINKPKRQIHMHLSFAEDEKCMYIAEGDSKKFRAQDRTGTEAVSCRGVARS